MLTIFRYRMFWLLVGYPKIKKINLHRTIILPVIMYGCETWSLTLREELRLSKQHM
jgi:hypothetical protein